jgi:integrase
MSEPIGVLRGGLRSIPDGTAHPVRRSITQVGGKLMEDNPKSAAGTRSIAIPERVMPLLNARLSARGPGEPAITSPNGSLLGLENWKRATWWRTMIVEIGRPSLRVHDLRHTYASLARRAGANSKGGDAYER